ncbi:MAG TPA: valine--tRNA ligase [Gemmatimonadaceae bacterium]|nr:valine--tRNA ligase [Gemmatimonadaceae bacterium]
MANELPADDIPSRYDPAANDPQLYRAWEDAGVFGAAADASNRTSGTHDPFVIVMPPPNVTGVLHMGHGLNNTVQDVLVRWRRMCGDAALWVPGTDHAGIATQNVVERELGKLGKTRQDLGREAFLVEVKKFVAEKGGIILKQLRAIGASADWSRTAYTFSPELSRAVREIFVRWYEDGLIYRGHRVIHWCSRCLTALSDEEAEHHDAQGNLYHVRYAVAGDPSRALVIATTRPETMFGDVAVAVHPEDGRYASFVGQRVVNPANGVEIPVIADAYVDRAFGTGALKITPAHDANDFEVGKRHGLEMPLVMTPDGKMAEFSDAAGRVPEAYRGVDRFDARKQVVKALDAAGALVKTEQHHHAVRRCYRCNTVVEPRLSDQWFVKMAPLAKPALDAVKDGRVRILPERWEAVYVNWMEGIRDWNISRQIWWGHRIPVFYCLAEKAGGSGQKAACREHFASRDDNPVCPDCGGPTRQDEDVLDTWFSSQLWPFSTLGWPDGKAGDADPFADLQAFYPTDVLVTAPEILFFWVARMIMSGMYVTQPRHRGKAFAHVPANAHPDGIPPFHTVYLTGTARDAQHRRMSKSLGNGIDPLDVVQLYGADALRWTVIAGMGIGADLLLDHENIEQSFSTGRNFATKLWNIGRFLLLQVGTEPVRAFGEIPEGELTAADRWINARLDHAITASAQALGRARPDRDVGTHGPAWSAGQRYAGLRLDEYAEAARQFVWNDLADWYVEHAKSRLAAPGADRELARATLAHMFDQALRLLHPIMPFVTETLWQRLPQHHAGTFLAQASWPAARAALASGDDFARVQDVITAVRAIRNEYSVAPGDSLRIALAGDSGDAAATRRAVATESAFVARMGKADIVPAADVAAGAAARRLLPDGTELVVSLAGMVDFAREREKLSTELAGLSNQLDALRSRLTNEKFTSRAPAAVVEAERAKERDWTTRAAQLAAKLADLGGT